MYAIHRPARALTVALVVVLVMMGVGAAPADKVAPAPSDSKAWLDAKSVCLFRLGAGSMPQDMAQLTAALLDGWKRSIALPDPAKVISVEGDAFPALDALHIDLTDGELRPSTKKDRIRVNNRIEESLKVSRLDVRGQPMLLRNARLNMSLIASGAQLAFERDRKGRPVMMLAEARSGMLAIDVTQADLESLLLQNARDAASKYGITVEKTRLKFTPQTPRSIQASLYVATKIGFVPAGMHFKAHMTIDNAMNARITGLTCDGDDVLGPIIVGLLRPALANYNGRTRPLLSFPAGKLQLRDVGLRVDDALHLTANFGS